MKNISYKRIVLFYSIAIIISNIFRFDIFKSTEFLQNNLPTWGSLTLIVLLEGIGIFMGALIALKYLNKCRKTSISFFGISKSKSILIAIIPMLFLVIIGVDNDYQMNSHIYGFFSFIITLLYCIMEEYGWRGYLQEELEAVKDWKKYLIIGFLWYIWHLSFLRNGVSFKDNVFFLSMMILGSVGIGKIADSTKSILISACFHLIIQIMMFNAIIKNGLTGTEKLIVLGGSLVAWMLIFKKLNKDNTSKEIKEYNK